MTTVNNNDSITRITSVIFAVLPMLSVYKSPIPFFDLGAFGVFVILGLQSLRLGFRWKLNLKASGLWLIYILYIAFISSLEAVGILPQIAKESNPYIVAIKYIIFLLTFLLLKDNKSLNSKITIETYILASKICAWFMIIQSLFFYMLRIAIPGYLPSLIFTQSYAERISYIGVGMFRPTSFFYEPSGYVEYTYCAIAFLLFLFETNKKNMLSASIISLGMLLSTSGQGVFFLVGIWGVWVLMKYKDSSKKSLLLAFTCSVIFLITAYMFLQSNMGSSTLDRLFSPSNGSMGAFEGRTESIKYVYQLEGIQRWFGMGYANRPDTIFMSSWIFNLYCTGIIGTAIAFFLYIKTFRESKEIVIKILLIFHLILCLVSTSFMGLSFLFEFSLFSLASDYKGKMLQCKKIRWFYRDE